MSARWLTKLQTRRMLSNPGCSMRPIYQAKNDPDGNRRLVKVGERNQTEEIQTFRDSCDLHKIIERCTLTGDYSPLVQRQPIYMDCTQMPHDLMEAHKAMDFAQKVYNNLTNEQKQSYEGFEGFLSVFKTTDGINAFLESLKPVESKIEASTPISTPEEVTE